jgi:LemA protein
LAFVAVFVLAPVSLSGCGVNRLPTLDEQVKAAWGEVLNQYQRRSDLIPNLVQTVKGYAHQEQQVLTQVIEARAKATQVQLPADILSNPQAFIDSNRTRRPSAALSDDFSQLARTIRTSSLIRISSRFSLSLKVPRIASQSHAATT